MRSTAAALPATAPAAQRGKTAPTPTMLVCTHARVSRQPLAHGRGAQFGHTPGMQPLCAATWRRRRARAAACTRASLGTEVLASVLSATPGLAVGAAVNALVFLSGIRVLLRGLTPAGVAHAAVLGSLVYAAFGLGGYALVCIYFLAGSAVTKLRLAQKQAEGIAEARAGRRSPASVWGSGAAGVACAIAALAVLPPGATLWRLGFVASFASKLGDTTSSEVGKAYGRTTYLSTTLQRVPRGTEGAVSLEGTAAGVAAISAFAALAVALGQACARCFDALAVAC